MLLFLFVVFAFAPEQLPEYKQRIIALVSAIMVAFFGYFFTGSIRLKLTWIPSKLGAFSVDATLGFALFVLVLLWWFSPFAPIKTRGGVATVHVTVLGSDKIPIEDAQVWNTVGGESKKVAGGWELEFPLSKLPKDRKITIYAVQKSAYLKGQRDIIVNEGKPTAALIQLDRETSVQVKGTVTDASGRPVAGANISIFGSASTTTTDAQGFFSLPANAAMGEEVRLRVSKVSYGTHDQYRPAGDDPAYIVLQRTKR